MRHAEKPADVHDPDLSPAGRQRAGLLVDFIQETFALPAFLFASAESKHSRRPIETLEPLSNNCGVSIDSSFADQDYAALAHELLKHNRYEDKLSVICWLHGNIPSIGHALQVPDGAYPDPWDRDVFNLILDVKCASGQPSVQKVKEPF